MYSLFTPTYCTLFSHVAGSQGLKTSHKPLIAPDRQLLKQLLSMGADQSA